MLKVERYKQTLVKEDSMVFNAKQMRRADALARAIVLAVSKLKEENDTDVHNEAVRIAHDKLDRNGLYASGNVIAQLREDN
jgi:hypothetical protein